MSRVLLVTTWDTPCGIAEHSYYVKQAVEAADPEIQISPYAEGLDPQCVIAREDWISQKDAILHLNYHAALHSRWTPEQIRAVQARGPKVVVTYHDTGVPNSDQCKAICAAADAFVIHEPADDLPMEKGHYWRMGVPALSGAVGEHTGDTYARPMLGTVGHDFPWKCWDQLAETAAAAGWGVLIYTPAMSPEHEGLLAAANPWLTVRRARGRVAVVDGLHECDATAFTFSCCNTGQSASILQGIGARKPVLAFNHCRQMRALYLDALGRRAIRWCETFEHVEVTLQRVPIQRVDPGIVALAHQESWTQVGRKYAALYKEVVG